MKMQGEKKDVLFMDISSKPKFFNISQFEARFIRFLNFYFGILFLINLNFNSELC